ncbi:MAG: 3,4-dehydroadipyl-CoA semialdehyde dehydrogenase [Deltaproteobacteria bacterium]|nr:3,4-dehydroadipyl-CoA semialdehyde dehydrogenase [Deltaproteobacteria bacterium]
MERIESFVEDKWTAGSGDGQPLLNPATEEVIATASSSGIDLDRALAHARRVGAASLGALTFRARGELIGKMATELTAKREALIESAMTNGGATRGDAKFDVDGAIGTLAAYAKLAEELPDARLLADGPGVALGRGPRFFGQHVYLPRAGVAVFVNAYNFPAWGFAEKAACALLAGMPVLVKPATATAHTAYLIARAIVDGGILPTGAMSFVAGAAHELVDLLGSQDVLAFTGSAATGRKLLGKKNIVEQRVPVNLEADSLNSAVLGPDVELGSETFSLFLKDVTRDVIQKAGQKCTAIRRVVVPASRVDDVVAELSARFAEIKVGNPAQREVGMGPLVSRTQLADVRSGVTLLREDADVLFGAPDAPVAALGAPEGKGFFHPILLLRARDPHGAQRVHSHEVFGPVATILTYSGHPEEATALVRRGDGSLVSSIYSDDRSFTEALVLGIAPWHGRLYLGSAKVADHTLGPGTVLPHSVHGGPGRAGGGEELGGLRGVLHFMQRTALQGYRPVVEAICGQRTDAKVD